MEANGVASSITASDTNLTDASFVPSTAGSPLPRISSSNLAFITANETSINIQQSNDNFNFLTVSESSLNTSVENYVNDMQLHSSAQYFSNIHLCDNNCSSVNSTTHQSSNSTNYLLTPEACGSTFANSVNFNLSSSFYSSTDISNYYSNFQGSTATTGVINSINNANQMAQFTNSMSTTVNTELISSYDQFYASSETSFQYFPLANHYAGIPNNIFQPQYPNQSCQFNQPTTLNEGFLANNEEGLLHSTSDQAISSSVLVDSSEAPEAMIINDDDDTNYTNNFPSASNDQETVTPNRFNDNDNRVVRSNQVSISRKSSGNDSTRKRCHRSADESKTEHRIKTVKIDKLDRSSNKEDHNKLQARNRKKRSSDDKNVLRPNIKQVTMSSRRVVVDFVSSDEDSDKEN